MCQKVCDRKVISVAVPSQILFISKLLQMIKKLVEVVFLLLRCLCCPLSVFSSIVEYYKGRRKRKSNTNKKWKSKYFWISQIFWFGRICHLGAICPAGWPPPAQSALAWNTRLQFLFWKKAKNLKGMKRNWENTNLQIFFLGGGGITHLQISDNNWKVDSHMHYLH